ncbi:prepilin-type N-terminal cleavage/methylation domain-containing protein [bacterium]|nr:prepilin-type N-terminal cleavage/methylation domain-containing protein [bacterium]
MMKNRRSTKVSELKNGGFTLVEMMIGVSILGLMLAIGTPPVIQFLRHIQSSDSAQIVSGVLRKARSGAIQDKNEYIVFFDLANSQMTILDDDGGGMGNPANAAFNPVNRGNGRQDNDERVLGPYQLPNGQVFGFVGGTIDPNGNYITKPVTFSGSPPQVVFFPNGSTNEEGLVFVMPEIEFREQKKGTDKMMIVRRSTGSVVLHDPTYY